MSLASEIERLQQQRQEHERAIAVIDDELARAAEAIGGRRVPSYEPKRNQQRELRPDGTIANEIVAALAAKEPCTAEDVWRAIGAGRFSSGYIQNTLQRMAISGVIARTRLNKQGRPSIYARTREAIDAFVAAPQAAPAEGDDELGIRRLSEAPDVALSSLDTDGVQ